MKPAALVTGGARGIGAAVARRFAALATFGRLDIVVLNAGIGGPGPISDGTST
ncbi:hypothetical protein [Sciscionella sediminilitoris]|uniref:hypothetical protein n=1 Tax=Sciscionella sediminilitoris TaxID=1445613 RepID=UPI001E5A5445|nr:hypothetical protein [Sciscionella sp. SE31]